MAAWHPYTSLPQVQQPSAKFPKEGPRRLIMVYPVNLQLLDPGNVIGFSIELLAMELCGAQV